MNNDLITVANRTFEIHVTKISFLFTEKSCDIRATWQDFLAPVNCYHNHVTKVNVKPFFVHKEPYKNVTLPKLLYSTAWVRYKSLLLFPFVRQKSDNVVQSFNCVKAYRQRYHLCLLPHLWFLSRRFRREQRSFIVPLCFLSSDNVVSGYVEIHLRFQPNVAKQTIFLLDFFVSQLPA